ncbi:MAG TPA: hypothetical protein VK921_16820 [Anditalea sp.]|nr:hypothetical protein [Anditalea sp.]
MFIIRYSTTSIFCVGRDSCLLFIMMADAGRRRIVVSHLLPDRDGVVRISHRDAETQGKKGKLYT